MAWTNEQLIADGKSVIDSFDAETIIYKPGTGAERNVRAIVDRDSPQTTPEVPQAMAPKMAISVINQATNFDDDGYGGISSSELDTGRDAVILAIRKGATPEERPLGPMTESDGGMIRLEVR